MNTGVGGNPRVHPPSYDLLKIPPVVLPAYTGSRGGRSRSPVPRPRMNESWFRTEPEGNLNPVASDFLRFGLVACILTFMRGELLGPEQHMYPKELILHVSAFGAASVYLWHARRVHVEVLDAVLVAFLALGVLSALGASNQWAALRSVSITASSVLIFWVSRSLARSGHAEEIIRFAVLAILLVATTALLEAYGIIHEIATTNRAPGGTIGNRNWMAHLLVLGIPLLFVEAVRTRGRLRFVSISVCLFVVVVALVLSRSRAAWLAGIILVCIGALMPLFGVANIRSVIKPYRIAVLGLVCLLAGLVAVHVPNELSWRSSQPYRDSLRTIAEYKGGSGKGRLLQYENTLHMVRDRPLLGVGPGNWAFEYPRYAPLDDPSYEPAALIPTPRHPNTEWIGFAAERGVPAVALLALFVLLLVYRCWKSFRRDRTPQVVLNSGGLLATLVGAVVIGLFDPVLMTPSAAFFVFALSGALAPESSREQSLRISPVRRAVLITALALIGTGPIVYSGMQLWAGSLYATEASAERLARAVRLNPGDYRARVLLAEALIRENRCDRAVQELNLARQLFPSALVPVLLLDQCRSRRSQITGIS